MAQRHYLDFELLIIRAGEAYRAEVVASPGGQASVEFSLPFSGERLENLLLRLGRPRVGVLGAGSSGMEAARTLGGGLFGAAFGGDILACLRASREEARRQGAGLRIRLRLAGTPELADLPWELLYDQALGRFLALSAATPLVRYFDLPEPPRPLRVQLPLRVLAIISAPSGWEPIDAGREWDNLRQASAEAEREGRAVLERLEPATVDALHHRLQRGEYHALHFVGHGGFRDGRGEGVLVFEDEHGGGRLVSAEEFGTLLHNHDPLRLAVLNACEGARSDPQDPFGGTAQTLVRQGLPAVIAMQLPITMAAAATLSRELYGALALGLPVDQALTEARVALRAGGNELEWATPVLFLRARDGVLYEVQAPASPPSDSTGHRESRPLPDEPRVARQPAPPPAPPPTQAAGQGGLDELRTRAAEYFWSEDWERAVPVLSELASGLPGDRTWASRLEKARHLLELTHLYSAGARACEVGEWAAAVEPLEKLTSLRADYEDAAALLERARQGLEAAKRRHEVAELYAEGTRAHEARSWGEAIGWFDQVLALQADYRDAAARLEDSRRHKERADLYAELRQLHVELRHLYEQGTRAYAARNWAEAISHLDALLALDPGHQDAAGLLESAKHQKEAEEQEERAGLQPAELYDNGRKASEPRSWAEAVQQFEAISKLKAAS